MKIARALYASIIKYCYPLLIAAITLWISATSYTSGTWLSGWDTLHPEFDFALNVERVINGVWREEQGLGALAGHSHMSELPRYVLLYLTSFVFPDHFLRYFYRYLCFIVGPLGIYCFVNALRRSHGVCSSIMACVLHCALSVCCRLEFFFAPEKRQIGDAAHRRYNRIDAYHQCILAPSACVPHYSSGRMGDAFADKLAVFRPDFFVEQGARLARRCRGITRTLD